MTYDLDPNGILNVSAVDKASNKKCHITITNEKGRLSKEDIAKCVEESEKYAEEDKQQRELVTAKNELLNFVYNCQQTVNENEDKFSEEDRETIKKAVQENEAWLDGLDSDGGSSEKITAETVNSRHKEIEKLLNPIMVKFHQQGAAQQQQQGGSSSDSSSADAEDLENAANRFTQDD